MASDKILILFVSCSKLKKNMFTTSDNKTCFFEYFSIVYHRIITEDCIRARRYKYRIFSFELMIIKLESRICVWYFPNHCFIKIFKHSKIQRLIEHSRMEFEMFVYLNLGYEICLGILHDWFVSHAVCENDPLMF